MSAIGGRSVNIGAAPDRSAAQTTATLKKDEQRFQKEFSKLSPEEQELVIAGGKFDKVPFGAEFSNLFARKEFRQGLANKFISAPSGANVDRRKAAERVATLNEAIERAKTAKQQNERDRAALEKSGLQIFAGSPLDIAFSNKTRSLNNIIAQAEAEKTGIGIQTDTGVRKKLFGNFKVITDKHFGKGRNRGVFDTSGNQGLNQATVDKIKSGNVTVADLETAKANAEQIKEFSQKRRQFALRTANFDQNSGRRASRTRRQQDQFGNVPLTQKTINIGEKEFFTDQLLSNDTSRVTRIESPEFAEFNKERLDVLSPEIEQKEAALKGGFVNILGRPVPFSKRFSSNIKSGENSKGISDLEREQFINRKAQELSGLKSEERDLENLAENPIVKVADNKSISKPRQASLFEALSTLNRILGLPQFSGDRGSNPTLKAQVGALNKVQKQRLSEQKKETSRRDVKLKFEKDLADIQSKDLSQKEKKAQILKLAKERDDALKGKTVTNIQFEQSRAGFAASQVNIPSGATVKTVQQLIEEGRKRRKQINA